jgi:O-antigen/teichoic acid export membrane protein
MPTIVRQFGKNVFSAGAALAVRFLLAFLVNPFIIHSLGNDLYGVWILLFSIINYMTILDLGLQQALVRFIAKFLGLKDYDKINAVLNTAFLVYLLVAIAVVIISLILSFFALGKFNIPAQFIAQARIALLIIGLNTAVNFAMLCWGGSLGAFHRYDIANAVSIIEDIARTVTLVFLLKSGYGIVALALAFLIFTTLRLTTLSIILKKLYSQVKIGRHFINRAAFRMLFNYGAIGFLISVVWLLISNTGNVIIAYFLDTAAVTQYAIAVGFIIALRSLIHTIGFPLQPVISHYETLDKKEYIGRIYTKGTKYLYFLTFMVGGATMAFADSLISLWIGPGYNQAATVLKILILPAAVYLPFAVGEAILFGIGKHKYFLYAVALEAILNLTLVLILIQKYGLLGVAYGTIAAQIIVYLFVLPPLIRPILGFGLANLYISIARSAIVAFAVSFGVSLLFISILKPTNWGYFFIETCLVTFLSLLAGYLLIIDNEDLSLIRLRLKRESIS